MFTFITSTSKDLYTRDMLNVCCKPTDDLISFSYSKDKIMIGSSRDLKDKEALIIFAEWREGKDPLYIFHPLRYCKIEKVIDNSENVSFTYYLKLKECVKYQDGINDPFIEKINAQIAPQINGEGEENGVNSLKYYFRDLQIGSPPPKEFIEYTSVWRNLVKHLGSRDVFHETIFFKQQVVNGRCIDFKESDLERHPPIELDTSKVYNLKFWVVAGKKR